jgi:hypothetical protein
MKFEALMLRSLFAACLLVCGLILGSMIGARPQAVQLAANGSIGALLLAAPTACLLPADELVCPRQEG